ncbi:MAG: hypothetical protein AAFY26_08065 [Cyanobacteria bacterium J06638_22]
MQYQNAQAARKNEQRYGNRMKAIALASMPRLPHFGSRSSRLDAGVLLDST